jgi:putative Mn2+ efflux pump MntP
MNAEILALYAATFSVAFFHTMSPDHWMPFVMFGKAKKWPIIKTELVALLAGIGHIGTSVIIAVVGIVIGSEISKNFASIAEVVTGTALILFGFGYAIYMWRKGGHVHFTIGGKYLAKNIAEHDHHQAEAHEKTHTHADGSVHVNHVAEAAVAPQPNTHVHADGSVHVNHVAEAPVAPQPNTHVHADGTVHVNHVAEAGVVPQPNTHVHADGTVHVNHVAEAAVAPQPNTHVHADGSVHVNHVAEAAVAPQPNTHVHADGSVHVNHVAETSAALQTNIAGDAHFAEIHSHAEEPHGHDHGEPHGHSHEGEHGHVHAQEAKSPYALVIIMGLTPCIALLPMAFAASTFGTGVTVLTISIFAISTLVPILGLTFLGSLGLAKLKLNWFEKYGDIITGVVIGCIGLMTMLLGL